MALDPDLPPPPPYARQLARLPPPPRPVATDSRPSNLPLLAVGFGMAMIMLGSLLTWATLITVFGSISISGTEGDGVITLILGFVGFGGAAVAYDGRRRAVIVPLLAAMAAMFIAVYDMTNLTDTMSQQSDVVHVQVGAGLWVIVIGAVLAGVSSFGSLGRR